MDEYRKKNQILAITIFMAATVLMVGVYFYISLAFPNNPDIGSLNFVGVIPFLFVWVFATIFLIANLRKNAPSSTENFTRKNVIKAIIFIVVVGFLFYLWAMNS